MGKGLNKRKRAKLVEAAKDGNLHKAQWGKASGSLKPPKAPSKEDFKEHIPASLRRLMAAKALAEEQEAKRRERKEASFRTEAAESDQVQQQPPKRTQQQGKSKSGSPSWTREEGAASTSGHAELPKSSQGPLKPAPASQDHKVFKLNAFDQAPKGKGITERKKAYYEKRKEKKKAKKQKGKPEAELTPAELKLRAQESATQARFGEIADAPLKVNLKRKHWTGGTESQGERMAKIQKAQLSRAQQQASEQPHKGQGTKKEKQLPGLQKAKSASATADEGRGLLHKARMQQAALDKEAARQAAVSAYRQQKKAHPSGSATMASLGRLAAQGAERLKQEQQQQQQ